MRITRGFINERKQKQMEKKRPAAVITDQRADVPSSYRSDLFSFIFKLLSEEMIVRTIADELYVLPQNSTVFFLGRYKNDVEVLMNDHDFSLRFPNQTQKISVICSLRPDLKITFMSIHQSKGLQADYVFLLKNKSSAMGFPAISKTLF